MVLVMQLAILIKENFFFCQVIKRCNDASIASVYDIMEMEDAQRNELLQMDGGQMYVLRTFFALSVVMLTTSDYLGGTLRRS